MAKVTGIGGVFFKARTDNKALSEWYAKNLGIELEIWGGSILRWPDDLAEDNGLTVWKLAEPDSTWFSPSDASFMINYRVDNMAEMYDQLKAAGVEILNEPEYHENGVFLTIMDPDRNRVELWEPRIWDEKNKR